MQRTSSINQLLTPCRPLITSSYFLGTIQSQKEIVKKCIKLPYSYYLKDIMSLQAYLCPGAKIIGVDFQTKPQKLPKTGYKNIIVAASTVIQGEKCQMCQASQFQIFSWNINLLVPLQSNGRQNLQQLKQYLINNLVIKTPQSNQQAVINQTISFNSLKQAKINCLISSNKRQSISKIKRKLFQTQIPIQLMLPRLQNYQTSRVLQLIGEDLAKSASIMSDNQLFYRTVQRFEKIVPINNFYQNPNQKDEIFDMFYVKSPIITDQFLQQEKKNNRASNQIKAKNQKGKNVMQLFIIVFILLATIAGYVYIKIY